MRLGPLTALIALTLPACVLAQEGSPGSAQVPPPPQTEEDKAALLKRVLENQKKSDAAMNLYERVERIETRKNAVDGLNAESKTSRVIPAGTGVDHIPIGPDGKPTDPDVYHADLVKLEKALSWAADDGHGQHDAYEKLAKKQRERDELIDATRTAFIYTFAGTETRGGKVLYKYNLEPNPAYKPTRAGTIFAKVRGYVWIDPAAEQMARIDGEVTGDINVGLFLAKIYKGSHFMQERYEMLPGLWMPTFSQYDFDGRKLFSAISIHERTFYSQYKRIGTPKEALAYIRAELNKSTGGISDP